MKSFYSKLYSTKSVKTEQEGLQYLASINMPKLSESESLPSPSSLTLKKCWEALQSMKNGKSPGNDGLTKEFCVCFFEEVAPPLLKSLNYAFTVRELSTSQKQAVITLIEKERRDQRLVKIGGQSLQ